MQDFFSPGSAACNLPVLDLWHILKMHHWTDCCNSRVWKYSWHHCSFPLLAVYEMTYIFFFKCEVLELAVQRTLLQMPKLCTIECWTSLLSGKQRRCIQTGISISVCWNRLVLALSIASFSRSLLFKEREGVDFWKTLLVSSLWKVVTKRTRALDSLGSLSADCTCSVVFSA